jgi:hypothetical protein
MKRTCETCRFFSPYSQESVPPEPAETIRWLGINWRRANWEIAGDRIERKVIVNRNNSGVCRRNPDAVRKHKTEWCGEYI